MGLVTDVMCDRLRASEDQFAEGAAGGGSKDIQGSVAIGIDGRGAAETTFRI